MSLEQGPCFVLITAVSLGLKKVAGTWSVLNKHLGSECMND